MCYTHQVLKEVCILVKGTYEELKDEYHWNFVSGCYKDGEAELMEQAQEGINYRFEDVPIKVYGIGEGQKAPTSY